MTSVSRLLNTLSGNDPQAASQLLPLVYDELRTLASQKLARELPGQTLQPTALVHEAFLRLVDGDIAGRWESKRHFFAAAAEAMRRILVDAARRKNSLKRGGKPDANAANDVLQRIALPSVDVLSIHEGLDELAGVNPEVAELVNLRFFAGLTLQESASILGVSERTAKRHWAFARGWLFQRLGTPVK